MLISRFKILVKGYSHDIYNLLMSDFLEFK